MRFTDELDTDLDPAAEAQLLAAEAAEYVRLVALARAGNRFAQRRVFDFTPPSIVHEARVEYPWLADQERPELCAPLSAPAAAKRVAEA